MKMKSIIILCGGYGKRMGQDKGLLSYIGKPLIIHVLKSACNFAEEVVLVLRSKGQQRIYEDILMEHDLLEKITICTDSIEDQGPLMGICTGLNCISTDKALIIPCDSPLISQSFMMNIYQYYSDIYDATVPERIDGELEPLHAIYNKRIIHQIKKQLKEDKRDVRSLLEALDVRYIPSHILDGSGKSFKNLNYPEDLDKID